MEAEKEGEKRKTWNGPRWSHKESSVHLDNAARNLNRMRSTKSWATPYHAKRSSHIPQNINCSDFECYAKSTHIAHYKRNKVTVLIDVGTIRVVVYIMKSVKEMLTNSSPIPLEAPWTIETPPTHFEEEQVQYQWESLLRIDLRGNAIRTCWWRRRSCHMTYGITELS